MIGTILTAAAGLGKQFLANRQEKSQAKHTRDLELIRNQARLAADKQTNNSNWEMAPLKSSPALAKNVAFVLFSTPIVISIVGPFFDGGGSLVAQMWHNLEIVPEYWRNAFLSITGSLYGLLSLRDAGLGQGIGSALSKLRKSSTQG